MTAASALESAGALLRDEPLGSRTTYRIGGPARYLVEAQSEDHVLLAARLAADEGLAVLPLGRGSNLVVADRGFDGVVVHSGHGLASLRFDDDGTVTAGAGMSLPRLARDTAQAGRGGLEFYTGIPGSVGGAVRMNAGCHGSETVDRLVSIRVIDLRAVTVADVPASDLELSYRSSRLRDSDFVVSAVFTTDEVDPDDALSRIREITRWRREHQPGGTLNAGSVFKNPPGDAAGRIIDSLGLKGLSVGGAAVSDRHANFVVAESGARAADIKALVEEVQRRVLEATGTLLEPELRFVGDFE